MPVTPKPRRLTNDAIVWDVQFRPTPGTTPRREIFDTKIDADAFIALADKVGWPAAVQARDMADIGSNVVPTREAFTDYLDEVRAHAETATVEKYQELWRNYIEEDFGDWPITQITKAQVVGWVHRLREEPSKASQMAIARAEAKRQAKIATLRRKGLSLKQATIEANSVIPLPEPRALSAKSIKNIHAVLSTALQMRVGKDLGLNPAKGVTLPRTEKMRPPVFLRHDEYAAIRSEVPEQWRLLIDFIAATGVRMGELMALRPEDFQLRATPPLVHVQRAFKRQRGTWKVGPPKTEAGVRYVSLPESIIRPLRKRLQETPRGQYLFTNTRGSRLDDNRFHQRVWNPACYRAGFLDPIPRLHDLRHTHASWLIEEGVDLKTIQRRLGHEKSSTTMDIYGHISPTSQARAATATEDIMDAIGKAGPVGPTT